MSALAGKTAVITGAASGIGRAIASSMAAAGCGVGLLDISAAGLEEGRAAIAARGGAVHAVEASVADPAAVTAGVDRLASRLGRVDILVNCAGILRLGRIVDIGLDDWDDTQRINVGGVLHTTRAAVPYLRRQPSGRIVNIASWMGKSGKAYYGAYCASKAAVISMTETLALELAEDGITVNAICPGIIMQTGMQDRARTDLERLGLPSVETRSATIPLKRLGQPEDVASIAVFLASEAAGYMTGHTVNVTGGMWLN